MLKSLELLEAINEAIGWHGDDAPFLMRHPGRDEGADGMRHLLAPRGINPDRLDIGRKVVYRTAPDYEAEEGVITSFNVLLVMVRYGSNVNSKATSREDLDWL